MSPRMNSFGPPMLWLGTVVSLLLIGRAYWVVFDAAEGRPSRSAEHTVAHSSVLANAASDPPSSLPGIQQRVIATLLTPPSTASVELDPLPSEPDTTRIDPEVCARGDDACPVVEQSLEMRRAMARCGTLRFDVPDGLHRGEVPHVPQAALSEANVGLDEREQLEQRSIEFHAQFAADIAAFGVRLLGEEARVLAGDVSGTMAALDRLVYEDPAITRVLAEERAGLRPFGAAAASNDRVAYLQYLMTSGDRYEQAIAEVVGARRAHHMRLVEDGWGSHSTHVGTCVGEVAAR